jgi:hypothetical protein
MSDFEYEVNENDDNDDNYDNYEYEYDYYNDDEYDDTDTKVIIDMDDMNDMNNEECKPTTIKPKLILKKNNQKEETIKENNIKSKSLHSFNSIINTDEKKKEGVQEQSTSKNKPKSKITTNTKLIVEKKESPDTSEKKLTKKEESFEFNQETIDFFTKDLDFKKILIKNSPFTNDTKTICLLLKYNLITEYCCSIKKCKVKTLWMDKPIQLILHRKNNIDNDLSSYNLELICGNCYLCLYGLDIFKKKEKEIIFKCDVCNFPLVQFNNQRKKKGICLACEKRVTKVFTEKMNSDYYNNIQELYNDNPLLSEDNKTNNYYKNKDIGKYKPSSTSTKAPVKSDSKLKPVIIPLNMSIPNLDDLLNK